jgi:hypothetical protein
MKLKVPYYSQRTDVIDSEWHAHSCLVMCIKMVAEFLGTKVISADDWIKEGIYIGAWDGKFWKHNEVIRLFRNHGIFGYAQEFKTVDVDINNGEMKIGKMSDIFLENGIKKISDNLDKNIPIIVSIYKYFTEKNRHHGIVLIGYEKDKNNELKGFYYHDPEMPDEKGGKDLFVEIGLFKKGWKRLAIFTEKI